MLGPPQNICEDLHMHTIFASCKCISTDLIGYLHLPEVIFSAEMLRDVPF